MQIILLHGITFLSAFLLFQIELIIAKLFLPVYGGSYAVWGACLVFFQAFLLLGYWFVHLIIGRTGIRNYRIVQLILLFLPLLTFPGRALRVGGESHLLFLSGDVFLRLVLTIGPVFFVLSTMSVALQMWLSASSLKQRANPYALYATSNAGSLGAILTYPFLFEVLCELQTQLMIWRVCYAVLALLNVLLFLYVPVQDPSAGEKLREHSSTPKTTAAVWLLLSAASVMMFMSVTSVVTYTIIPIPLLWIIPFSIYILAFILNFKPKPWCPKWIKKFIHAVLIGCALLYFAMHSKGFSVVIGLFLFSTAVFLICFYCQNQLAERRPASDSELTKFYLIISLGGCLGGVLTSWVMPLISKSVVEYLVGLTFIAIAVWIIEWKIAPPPSGTWNKLRSWSTAIVPLLLVFFWTIDLTGYQGAIYKHRNYYGMYEVKRMKGANLLVHGTTMHGMQFTDKTLELEPTCMFSKTSPIGEVLYSGQFKFRDIAVIGLGAGTLSIYTEPGQTMDYYELDPDVYDIAKKYFTFLDNAKGKIRFFFGDARQTLEKAKDRKYDLLVVDAFGGDSIPVHLLTVEAINLYTQRLNPGGVLMFHISNRYIRLEPVLTLACKVFGAYGGYRATSGEPYGTGSTWVAFTWDKTSFEKLVTALHWYPLVYLIQERHRLWTDGYSNILPVIKTKKLRESLSDCRLFF